MISYAQNFEDVMLARLFDGRKDGFYVDVGAADPEFLSVTKWFYDQGWQGINIEPNASLFEKLVQDRPRDVNLNCGVGAFKRTMPYFEASVGELSTFDSQTWQSAIEAGITGITKQMEIIPLTDILAQHSVGRQIDFLKIDVEGLEHEVLLGLDLSTFRPSVILIEATRPMTRIESHVGWEKLLIDHQYTFVHFDGLNRFYLENSKIALRSHFDQPPNVFDDFKIHQHVVAETEVSQLKQRVGEMESNARLLSSQLNTERQRLIQVISSLHRYHNFLPIKIARTLQKTYRWACKTLTHRFS